MRRGQNLDVSIPAANMSADDKAVKFDLTQTAAGCYYWTLNPVNDTVSGAVSQMAKMYS